MRFFFPFVSIKKKREREIESFLQSAMKTPSKRRTRRARPRRSGGLCLVLFLFLLFVFFAAKKSVEGKSGGGEDENDDENIALEIDDFGDDYHVEGEDGSSSSSKEDMESYALQLDDFTGEILKPPRQKARQEPEWIASLASLPSNCSGHRGGSGNGSRGREEEVSLHRMPLRLPANRIALKDIFVTRENYKRLGFGGIKRYYALPPNAAAIAKKYRWKRCAVLGNSGTLLDASFGGTIDSHDVVFRMNQAPVKGYELHVGKKSTFRVLNSLWSHRYSHGYAPWDPGYQNLPLEKDVTLILTRVDATIFNEMHEFWRKRRPDITLLILSSKVINIIRQTLVDYRSRLCAAGVESAGGPGGNTPSSGWVSVYAAMQLCGKVNAYGFGTKVAGAGENGGTKEVSYHYYTGMAARKFGTDVHSFESEKMLIEHLDRSKKITLCTSAGSKEDANKKHRRGFMPVDAQCGKA